MRYSIDEDARILHIDMAADPADRILSTTLTLIGDRPELCGWDWIVEGRPLPDDATANHLARLAQAWGPSPVVEAVTVFVTDDALLHLWARVMDFQFVHRKLRAPKTPGNARAGGGAAADRKAARASPFA